MGSVPVDLNEIAPTAPEFEEARRSTRRPWVTWGAVGFLVVASAGVGWYMAGTRFAADPDAGVPLVRADPAPIKTRPDDPGGTQVPDRDKLVYGRLQGRASPTRVERMLPPPEAPQPLSDLETAAGHPTAADAEPGQPAPMDPAKAAPPPPPPPPDPTAEANAKPESLLPPKTTSAEVPAKLDRPPKTMGELVAATVDDEPAKSAAAPPAETPSTDATGTGAAEGSAKAEPATKPAAEAKAKPVTTAKAEPPTTAPAPPPPPPPADAPAAKAVPAPAPAAKVESVPDSKAAAKAASETPPPAAPKPEPAPAPAQVAAADGDGFRIQIAAVRSVDSAEREWARLQKKHADLLGGLTSMVEKADLGKKGVYYRLRAGMLPAEAAAKDLCAALKARKVGCIVVRKGS